jgi:hypothetical protein
VTLVLDKQRVQDRIEGQNPSIGMTGPDKGEPGHDPERRVRPRVPLSGATAEYLHSIRRAACVAEGRELNACLLGHGRCAQGRNLSSSCGGLSCRRTAFSTRAAKVS